MKQSNRRRSDWTATGRGATKTALLIWILASITMCGAVIAFAAAAVIFAARAESRREQSESWVDHTERVTIAIDSLLISATDAETSQRGYLLTQDAKFLEPYNRGTADVWRQFAILRNLTVDNPDQLRRLMVLQDQLRTRIASLSQNIALERSGNSAAAIASVRTGRGRVLMDAIRNSTGDMAAEENRLLLARLAEQDKARKESDEISTILVIFGSLGILVSGGAAGLAVAGTSSARRAAATSAERQRLLNLMDLAPTMIRDLDGTIRFWSEGCRRLYGWTAEQAIGQSAHELLRTVFPLPSGEIDARLLEKREWRGELQSRTRDGAEVMVLAHKFVEEYQDGGGLAVMETVTDVTELRRAEAHLRASEAQLGLFIANAPAAIVMFDTAMRYLAVSRRFVIDHRISNETPATLTGRCHYDVFPEISDHWRAIHSRVLAGETLSSDAEAFPRADGRTDWVKWEMDPWRRGDGTIGGALLFSEYVTEQKEAEQALRENQERLRLVHQVGGIAYFEQVAEAPEAQISEEFSRMFGLPLVQAQINRDEFLALVDPADRVRIATISQPTAARDGKPATEFRIRRPDGEHRSVSMRTCVFLGSDGQPQRVIAALQDITDIVAAREILAARREELERSNADLEEFAYAISHDLKAPLRAIGNLSRWIAEDVKETATAETTSNLELLEGRVATMQKLLEGLLQYSRVGQTEATTEDFAIADVVADVVSMLGVPPGFSVTYEGKIARLRTQRVALQVVLENLISNSVKHHDRAEGKVAISTRLVDGLTEFRVVDDGPGIPEQFHRRIFTIFQTLDSREGVDSTGIGLAVVKRKVERHGGRIWVESAPPARGTIFVFTWKESAA